MPIYIYHVTSQVYNIDKRIQEDNLQHLALFSEYGRMALGGGSDEKDTGKKEEKEKKKEEGEEEIDTDADGAKLEEKTSEKEDRGTAGVRSLGRERERGGGEVAWCGNCGHPYTRGSDSNT